MAYSVPDLGYAFDALEPHIDAFFENLDWDIVNGWISTYRIPAA